MRWSRAFLRWMGFKRRILVLDSGLGALRLTAGASSCDENFKGFADGN